MHLCWFLIYFPCGQELVDWHRPQVEAIWRSGVDLLAFETIPSQKEAEAIVLLLREIPEAKAFISFSCQVHIHILCIHTHYDSSLSLCISLSLCFSWFCCEL